MKKMIALAVVMGALSSASFATPSLVEIYDKYSNNGNLDQTNLTNKTYTWSGTNAPAVGDISSVKVFREGPKGLDYWYVVLYDNNGDASAYLHSLKSDGWAGLYAVMRHSGFERARNYIADQLEVQLGESFDRSDFNIPYRGEQTSGYADAYLNPNGGTASFTINDNYASLTGYAEVIDPNGQVHQIDVYAVTYEDGFSYGYISEDEIIHFVSDVATDLIEDAFQEGWDHGYDQGYDDGYQDGFVDGYNAGWDDALTQATNEIRP